MKESSIEQKAKAYDEALKKAESIYNETAIPSATTKGICTYIFPELKESKDDRIRKWIIGILSTYEHDRDFRNAAIDWLEKQGKQKPVISNDALREGIAHFGITQYQIDNWLKKYVDVEKQGEQNLANSAKTCKIKPKFNEGDWVFIEYVKGYKNGPFQIKVVDSFGYSFDEYYTIPFMYEELLSKWIIQDAKDGDVLAAKTTIGYPNPFIAIYKEHGLNFFNSHCFVSCDGEFHEGTTGHSISDIHPATKEQCDFLFQKMKEAGYELDDEKKELKKIELQPSQWNISDFRTWQYIVSDVLTKHDGIGQYLDDGFCKKVAKYMQEEWSKKLSLGQNTAEWSEEDKKMHDFAIRAIGLCKQYAINHQVNGYSNLPDVPKKYEELQDWLKSLKDRVQPQLKQEWGEEDERNLNDAILFIETGTYSLDKDNLINWLKSLRPQSQWKPSDEQMKALEWQVNNTSEDSWQYEESKNLLKQLKNLK